MGILGNLSDGVTGSIDNILSTLKNPFANNKPTRFQPDFPNGFIIQEFIDGQAAEKITLLGDMLPFQPFTFGGEQKIVKDYYAGNSEPVVQVLGSREADLVIKGRLKAKAFDNPGGKKDGSLYGAPEAFQRQMDAFRIRGNLLKLTLGEWKRYAFLEKTKFDIGIMARIDYELSFVIVGFNKPINAYFVDQTKSVPFDINKSLIAAVLALEDSPPAMPKTISGVLNGYISDVAAVIAVATNFIDTTLKTVDDIEGSLNRAIGLIKNARTAISVFKRRLRTIQLNATTIGSSYRTSTAGLISATKSLATINANTINNASFILGTMHTTNNLSTILEKMQKQLEALKATTPQARYLVKQGDTLQKLAVKYYNDLNQWKLIYDHNHLTSTLLNVGSILEIPKL